MSIRHASEESATIAPSSKFLRGLNYSKLETKIGAVIENTPTVSAVSNIGTTAYITGAYTQASTGGIPTSYTCTSSPGGLTATQLTLTKPFVITGLTSNTSYTFTVAANNGSGSFVGTASSSITTTISTFSAAANQSVADLHTLATTMANGTTTTTPTAGGTLTVNSVALGSYDYTIKRGDQTVSDTFTNSTWFTTTEDTRSAFVVVDGNLTINSKALFRPSVRKLFTCIYVTGDLQVDGDISMRNRGANHSATSSGTIRLHTGTFSSVANPQVPSSGGGGGASVSKSGAVGSVAGNAGTAGTAGGTGGGGSGKVSIAGDGTGTTLNSGGGATGTSFSGGPGGGTVMIYSGPGTFSATAGTANGGRGGRAGQSNTYSASGGVGNPTGESNAGGTWGSQPWDLNYWAADGPTRGGGTGGILVIFVKGTLLGKSGTISANGCQGNTYRYPYYMSESGGGSGGGSVTVFYNYDGSQITPTANGGTSNGGSGGAGTARKLSLI